MNYSSSISVRNVTEPSFGDALTCSAVLEWVIPNGWTKCITEESQQSFQRGMRSVLIPVAMTDMSLFTAVMYVSARRYSLISNNTAEAEKYHKLMIHYLLICLQKIKVIINMESYPTDAAMALVLCMATEAVCTMAISQNMSSLLDLVHCMQSHFADQSSLIVLGGASGSISHSWNGLHQDG